MRRRRSYVEVVLVVLGLLGTAFAQLRMGFYDETCPNAEKIVRRYVRKHIPSTPALPARLIRLQFHDCFVRGCDASVLINGTSTNQTEKNAITSLTLQGFDFIDEVKRQVEAECPGVVSCADIVAMAARDSVAAIGGPRWKVRTGRRDGIVSEEADAVANIPAPTSNFTALETSFANKGLSVKDLVLLSGAHTIGVSHCSSFSRRLYNFSGSGEPDPSLDSKYVAELKSKCRTQNDSTTIVEMDPGSFRTFDLSYYDQLVKRKGLFGTDAALITDSSSRTYIDQLLQKTTSQFFREFASAMKRMGQIGVKTGMEGEIRNHCALVNSN